MSNTDFYLEQLLPLVGGNLTRLVRSGSPDPSDPCDEEFFGFKVQCKDGKVRTLILLSDDEGNGPGSFEIYVES